MRRSLWIVLAVVLCIVAGVSTPVSAKEVSLYDSAGKPAAYIDTEGDATIYLWNGMPVGYIYGSDADSLQAWGFNGKHLGWMDAGILYDQDGAIACASKDAYRGTTIRVEPRKGPKQKAPARTLRELPPLKPAFSAVNSKTACAEYLMHGTN
jgi:hypothetical protein